MPATISREVQRGRWLLAIAIGITLLGDAVVILLKISRSGLAVSEGSVVRWFFTAALLYAVWRGHRWARWLMVALLGVGLLLTLPAMLRSLHPLVIGIVFQFGVTLALLAFSRSVSAFIDHQRTQQY